jgi:hypothetical protein
MTDKVNIAFYQPVARPAWVISPMLSGHIAASLWFPIARFFQKWRLWCRADTAIRKKLMGFGWCHLSLIPELEETIQNGSR